MGESVASWGIDIEIMAEKQWGFGVGLAHFLDETYLYINFFKLTILIGKISKAA